MTTDINIINVNGLDYPIKDQKARDIAESAVKIFAYYEDGLVASQAYATIGTPICWKGELYYTITTVAKGNIWQVGVNLTPGDKAGLILARVNDIEDELTANGSRIYMDYQDGKYGYNIDPQRGADTFHPFSSGPLNANWTRVSTGGTTYTASESGNYMIWIMNGNIDRISWAVSHWIYVNDVSVPIFQSQTGVWERRVADLETEFCNVRTSMTFVQLNAGDRVTASTKSQYDIVSSVAPVVWKFEP